MKKLGVMGFVVENPPELPLETDLLKITNQSIFLVEQNAAFKALIPIYLSDEQAVTTLLSVLVYDSNPG